MHYKEGKINRVYIVTFSHGENFLEGIKDFIKSKDIKFGTLSIIGAITEADIVTGPSKKECPPEPNFKKIDDVREVLGFGILTNSNGNITLHIYGGFGKGEVSVVGCLRKGAEVERRLRGQPEQQSYQPAGVLRRENCPAGAVRLRRDQQFETRTLGSAVGWQPG